MLNLCRRCSPTAHGNVACKFVLVTSNQHGLVRFAQTTQSQKINKPALSLSSPPSSSPSSPDPTSSSFKDSMVQGQTASPEKKKSEEDIQLEQTEKEIENRRLNLYKRYVLPWGSWGRHLGRWAFYRPSPYLLDDPLLFFRSRSKRTMLGKYNVFPHRLRRDKKRREKWKGYTELKPIRRAIDQFNSKKQFQKRVIRSIKKPKINLISRNLVQISTQVTKRDLELVKQDEQLKRSLKQQEKRLELSGNMEKMKIVLLKLKRLQEKEDKLNEHAKRSLSSIRNNKKIIYSEREMNELLNMIHAEGKVFIKRYRQQAPLRYQILSSAIVERLPLASPPILPHKQLYLQFLKDRRQRKMEIKREIREKNMTKEEKAREVEIERQRALREEKEKKELTEEEKKRSKRVLITEDDVKNNRKSLNRKLWQRLYLIVKTEDEYFPWSFPKGVVPSLDYSLRQVAEIRIRKECGNGLEVFPFLNAPVGHLQFTYPRVYQGKPVSRKGRNPRGIQDDEFDGTTTFFHRFIYLNGQVKIDPKKVVDYAWVSRDELVQYFDPLLLQISLHMLEP